MFLFIRLLLAHFLGDFPFQFNVVYKLKFRGLRGIIPHALIIFSCLVLLSWPYLRIPQLWFFLIFVSASHLLQDSLKLNFKAPKNCFWAYVGDQLFHVATIAVIFLLDLKDLKAPAAQSNFFVWLYCDNETIIYLIALIAATYNGHFLIRCFKDTFIKNANPCDLYEKWFGMFERTLIVTFFFFRLPLWAIVPLSIAIRPMTYVLLKKRLSLHRCFVAVPDMVLSWIIALSCGFSLYLLQTRYPVY